MQRQWKYPAKNGFMDVRKQAVCGCFGGSISKVVIYFVVLLLLLAPAVSNAKRLVRPRDECYDEDRNPKFCQPEFENLALKKTVVVSETCGIPKTDSFCKLHDSNRQITRVCDTCERSGSLAHPAKYMTDINDNGNITYWQSRPIEGRREVTLTISFEKKYELSYISLQFHSPRPEAMIIYKSVNHGRNWIPYQFYARNCQLRFGLPNHAHSNYTGDHEALCLEDSSDPLPLSGGRVVFKPTRYRPSENNFENSHVLQEWVTATDIKIVLAGVNDLSGVVPSVSNGYAKRKAGARSSRPRRLQSHHRHGESGIHYSHRKGSRRSAPAQDSGHPPARVTKYAFGASQFYAINDVTIGGRCKCNGHASQCIMKKGRLACDCRHNTDGPNCEKCKAFHFDKPWKSATRTNSNECVGKTNNISCFSSGLFYVTV